MTYICINNNSETIYDVKIVIDNSLCLSGIKINLYTDELVVSYPDTIAPVDNKVIDRPSVYHTDTPVPIYPAGAVIWDTGIPAAKS